MAAVAEMKPEVVVGNRKVKAKKDAFCAWVEANKHKSIFVCTHDNPDPDALAAAMGMSHILKFLGAEDVRSFYCGEISHPQNRAMHNVLDVPVDQWDKQTESKVSGNTVFVFVDCAGRQKNMSIPFDPHVAVDHHKSMASKDVLFIHDEVGACATLITDLMLSICHREEDSSGLGGEPTVFHCFDPEVEGMHEIATALAIGIKTDTIDFRGETTTDDDFRAYKFLTGCMDDAKFSKIINYELPPFIFESEMIAWQNKKLNGPNLITGLGFLEESRSDCIPYLADHLMRLSGVQTVLVYAIVNNAIRASLRTTSATLDAGSICNEIFGHGNGGGKYGSAGANVSFSVFDIDTFAELDKLKFWELTRLTVERKFEIATIK